MILKIEIRDPLWNYFAIERAKQLEYAKENYEQNRKRPKMTCPSEKIF